jgi:predicted RNA-binding protein YlxR (DUF448 family)
MSPNFQVCGDSGQHGQQPLLPLSERRERLPFRNLPVREGPLQSRAHQGQRLRAGDRRNPREHRLEGLRVDLAPELFERLGGVPGQVPLEERDTRAALLVLLVFLVLDAGPGEQHLGDPSARGRPAQPGQGDRRTPPHLVPRVVQRRLDRRPDLGVAAHQTQRDQRTRRHRGLRVGGRPKQRRNALVRLLREPGQRVDRRHPLLGRGVGLGQDVQERRYARPHRVIRRQLDGRVDAVLRLAVEAVPVLELVLDPPLAVAQRRRRPQDLLAAARVLAEAGHREPVG